MFTTSMWALLRLERFFGSPNATTCTRSSGPSLWRAASAAHWAGSAIAQLRNPRRSLVLRCVCYQSTSLFRIPGRSCTASCRTDFMAPERSTSLLNTPLPMTHMRVIAEM